MRTWIENRVYALHSMLIILIRKLRHAFGWLNSKRIKTTMGCGFVKIHPWQIKLFKCVTPSDFYVVTGIYDALIKTGICEGYRNFGFSYNTFKEILHILKRNYKWNEETRWGDIRGISFTWALGSTPMSMKGFEDWVVVWNSSEVKGEIDGTID